MMNRFFTLLLAASCLTAVGQSDDCVEDLDLDGICDDVDSCVGIIDILGVCNGGCLQNLDGDFICDDQDLCVDVEACNYNDPANNQCHYLDECGWCLSPSQALWCPFWEDFFYEMNLVLAPNCYFDGGVSGLVGLSLGSNGNIVGLQGNGILTNVGAWSFNECDCIAGIAFGQSELFLGATLSIPSITSGCGVENIPLMVDADGNVFVETGCCQFVGSENQCAGVFDECGVCDGPGAIYDCGCDSRPFGDCDCNGNVTDVIGVCGGTCQNDYNNNGICDDQEVKGCTYILAENFDSYATDDDGSCIFPCEGVVNTNVFDWDGDHVVTVTDFLMMLSVYGDTDVDLDGVWDSVDDCLDTNACNYASDPSEPCAYIDILGICGGGCEADEDADGICDDIDTCIGIEDECGVCNGPGPTEVVIDQIITTYDSVYLPVDGEWFVYAVEVDTTFTYTCAPTQGCMDTESCTYNAEATYSDLSQCLYSDCQGTCGGEVHATDCGTYESSLYGSELAVFSECLEGDLGFQNGSVVILSANNTIVQYANGTSIVVGLWSFDACECAADNEDVEDANPGQGALTIELYISLDCEAFELSVDSDGVIIQNDVNPCDCIVEIIDN